MILTDEKGNVVFKGGKKGKVEFAKNNPVVRQVITTASGQKVFIPVMMGSETTVEPLKDGTYKVVSRPVTNPPQEPKVTIMSEAELIENFGKYTPKLDVQV